MKTWEMIKMLTENPKLKFKRAVDRDDRAILIKNGILTWENGLREPFILGLKGSACPICSCAIRGTIDKDDWEIVPQSVTWQEAIQAWIDGKTVKCCNCPGCAEYPSGCEDAKNEIINSIKAIDSSPCYEQIKYGTWYIKE